MTTIDGIIKFIEDYKLPPSGWKDDEQLIPVSTIIPQLQSLKSDIQDKHNENEYIKIDYYCTSCGEHITNRMGCPNSNCRGKQMLC